ncbi:hypothetical protein B296_00035279 [Ensete ventricosum]|uniref:Uncharacterized protein n=1 Tax=Ensete ventricosum TaxID=4639 RepID=A0A426YVQ4_ENSVE|nr:hypothetical protein B296_00035279 [Ensete ventricosum]
MEWDLVGSSLEVHRRDREARWEHARRSPEEDHKTHRKNAGGYRIYRTVEQLVSNGCNTIADVFGQLTVTEPPRSMVEPSVPYFQGAFRGCIVGANG